MARRNLLAHADKLHALRVLVEIGNFRRAAVRLAVTPSALSQAIGTLEHYLGEQLVIRAQKVTATPHAVHLLTTVGPALDAILGVEQPSSPTLPATKLRLGAYESLAVYALPDLLARIGAKHPSLIVTIRTGRSGLLAQLVRRGDLDAALVVENDLVGRLAAEVLAHDELGLYAAPAHRVFRTGIAKDTPYAGLAPGADGLPRFYRRFLRAMGVSARPFIECDSFEALRMMAVRNVAIAVLPRRVAMRTPGELRVLPPPPNAPGGAGTHAICLVSRPGVNGRVRDVLAGELTSLLAAA